MVQEKEKLKYPKSVFFIISNEFCERFNYYGMRTVLVIYLVNQLAYSESDAKVIYHTFAMLTYFFPLLGAILSDSYLGKFRTILYVSMVYASGSVLLALSSAKPLHLPEAELAILGLLLIAVGTGGIKPCVSAFGGDQFVLPQQEVQLARYFSWFYFSINAGSLISTFLTPVLRNDVHCLGQESCFPLSFGIPGILMIISIVIFAAGKPLYKIKKPEGNVVLEVCKCITYAVKQKIKSKEKKDHWLYYAEDKYSEKLIKDIKASLKVLVLYIPLPIFWALYDQQGSGWTLQAVRMDGEIGFYTILPDQMQVVNPLLILAFIPVFNYFLYPVLSKCNFLVTSLQRMVVGGFLVAISFAISGFVSMALESSYPELPSPGNVQLRVYNPSGCNVTFNAPDLNINDQLLQPLGYYEDKHVTLTGNATVEFHLESPCFNYTDGQFFVSEAKAYALYFGKNEAKSYEDDIDKPSDGLPQIRTLDFNADTDTVYKQGSYSVVVPKGNTQLYSLANPGTYTINDKHDVSFKLGGKYTIMLNGGNSIERIIVTNANSVHILWLLPQYFIITAAEVMFSITGLEFSYSQAPLSMKSLMQGAWLLTTAVGNLIIVVIESAKFFEKQSNDFFLYTALMVADILLFMYLAIKYKYVNFDESESQELQDTPEKKLRNGIENSSVKDTENGKARS